MKKELSLPLDRAKNILKYLEQISLRIRTHKDKLSLEDLENLSKLARYTKKYLPIRLEFPQYPSPDYNDIKDFKEAADKISHLTKTYQRLAALTLPLITCLAFISFVALVIFVPIGIVMAQFLLCLAVTAACLGVGIGVCLDHRPNVYQQLQSDVYKQSQSAACDTLKTGFDDPDCPTTDKIIHSITNFLSGA